MAPVVLSFAGGGVKMLHYIAISIAEHPINSNSVPFICVNLR